MKLRRVRGCLRDSMNTVIEIEPTKKALMQAINEAMKPFFQVTGKDIKVSHYGYDDRIKWDTYIVEVGKHGIYGFTDSALID